MPARELKLFGDIRAGRTIVGRLTVVRITVCAKQGKAELIIAATLIEMVPTRLMFLCRACGMIDRRGSNTDLRQLYFRTCRSQAIAVTDGKPFEIDHWQRYL